MKNIALLVFTLVVMISCDKKEDVPAELESKTYTGNFVRSAPTVDYIPAEVSLTLSNGQFTGYSNIGTYPAICKGTYKFSGQGIEFFNDCAWPTNFDHTFILDGKFNLAVEGDKILMTRGYDGAFSDMYVLQKQ